jgi:predicted ArsR family transcriptional regulator
MEMQAKFPGNAPLSSLTDEKNKSISPIEERLISILKDGGPLTRDQLVKKMDVPRTTIYDGLKKLIMRNEVKKYPYYKADQIRGRPPVMFVVLDDKK